MDATECPLSRQRGLVVIPCLNEAEFIGGLLDRLLVDCAALDATIAVVDGGSTDGTLAIAQAVVAKDRRVVVLENGARLQSAGVNLAVRQLAGSAAWIVRVDAHAHYPAGYVTTLLAEADRRPEASAIVVPLIAKGEGCFQRAVVAAQNSWLGTGGSAHRRLGAVGWVDHGHHALIRMDAFLRAGGYDESFSHNEDAELDERLTSGGGKIWLTNEVCVTYFPRRTLSALWRQYFGYGHGRARTVLKHRTRLKVRQALPLLVAPACVAALAAPFSWPLALPFIGWVGASLVLGFIVGVRAGGGCALLCGAPAMIMHLAWSSGFLSATLTKLK
ncbi:MAG: glycosyltransferase family 2 protein [Parcubacteria group bacterium]